MPAAIVQWHNRRREENLFFVQLPNAAAAQTE